MRKLIWDYVLPIVLLFITLFVAYHEFPHLREHADKNVYTTSNGNETYKTTQGNCINGLYFVYGGNNVTQVIGHDGKPVTCTTELVKGSKFEWSELWN